MISTKTATGNLSGGVRRASRPRIVLTGAMIAVAITGFACGSSTSTTTTSPTATLTYTTDTLTGTVNAPVNGTPQSDFKTFTVNASGGSVAVALTSAVEAMPDGSLWVSVPMGIAAGTVSNGSCSVPSGSFVIAQGSSAVVLGSSSVAAGTYCVQVSDVSSQKGPVTYAVVIQHA
jgi:hypothetical protein